MDIGTSLGLDHYRALIDFDGGGACNIDIIEVDVWVGEVGCKVGGGNIRNVDVEIARIHMGYIRWLEGL